MLDTFIAMIDYAGLNFEMEACGTDVWEHNGKERVSKEKQKLKVSSVHFKQCICFFSDALY